MYINIHEHTETIFSSVNTKSLNYVDTKYFEPSNKPLKKILCTTYYIKQRVFSENFAVTVTLYMKFFTMRKYQHHKLNYHLVQLCHSLCF